MRELGLQRFDSGFVWRLGGMLILVESMLQIIINREEGQPSRTQELTTSQPLGFVPEWKTPSGRLVLSGHS